MSSESKTRRRHDGPEESDKERRDRKLLEEVRERREKRLRDKGVFFSPEDELEENVGSYEKFVEEREAAKKRKRARERIRWGLHYARRSPCSHPALIK